MQTAPATTARHASVHAGLFAFVMLGLSALALSGVRATPPAADSDLVKGKVAREFETHYDAAFPAKTIGVNLWAAIDYTLFHEGRPGIVLGRGGWLYTDEEFRVENDAAATVERNLALVGWIHAQLQARGIGLVVALVPAKARVYPEHLARRQPPALHRALYAEALARLRRDGITVADLLPALSEGKAQADTFLRTDTHWTPFGAELAASALADAARGAGLTGQGTTSFTSVAEPAREHRGDLFSYLPLDPWFSALLPAPERIAPMKIEATSAADDLLGDGAAAQVALVGTSYSANPLWNFAGALKQALHEDVLNYAKDGLGPFAPMLDYLKSDDLKAAPPRLIVWEIPERYLPATQKLDTYLLPPEAYAAGRNPSTLAPTGERP